MILTDTEVEGLVGDLLYARKMGDFLSALDIEADLQRAGIRISEGLYGLRWRRHQVEIN